MANPTTDMHAAIAAYFIKAMRPIWPGLTKRETPIAYANTRSTRRDRSMVNWFYTSVPCEHDYEYEGVFLQGGTKVYKCKLCGRTRLKRLYA